METPQYLRLIDVAGRIVFEKKDLNEGTTTQTIDVQAFNAGIYMLQLGRAEGVESRKLMIQR